MGSVGRLVVVSGEKAARAAKSTRIRNAVLELSDNAIQRLRFLQSKTDKPVNAFRLGVKEASGCVGASYSLQYDDPSLATKLDETITDPETGIKVVVDPKALMYVIGTKMDFVEGDAESQFVFYNPNATAVCGCGQSFSVDPKHKE